MRLHNLEITFHRTVKVAEGRTASNLPPSLGHMKLYKVSDYKDNCPAEWAQDAYFMSLHDTEAMWISFRPYETAQAVLMGAGGVNALTGQKLGTTLEKDNYMVCPPQPWIDGWKDSDGTVHQFIATPHKKGEGITVGEQLIGKDSQTGAIGIAIFEPKDEHRAKMKLRSYKHVGGLTGQSMGGVEVWENSAIPDSYTPTAYSTTMIYSPSASSSGLHTNSATKMLRSSQPQMRGPAKTVEYGLGKGGKIVQKIYADEQGVEVWQDKPAVVFAFYLVDAKTAAEITGKTVAAPVAYTDYSGAWYGVKDEKLPDVLGTSAFAGLQSAAFPAHVKEKESPSEETETVVDIPVTTESGA